LGTDGGQAYNPKPPEMLQAFAEALLAEDIEPHELRAMMCTHPARLLDLSMD